MEWKYWLWVVLVAFLLGGLCECEGCWDQEKTALLQLKPFFTYIDEGKQSSNCCEWERVECNTSTGRVIRLFLNLTATWSSGDLIDTVYSYTYVEYEWSSESERHKWYLNASLFLPFDELKSLYLSGNSIAGCVDNQGFEVLSSKLNKLEILDLSDNHFNDSILASLSELSSLESLSLARNQFIGSNPTEGIKRLSQLNKLKTLDLRGNIIGNNILSHLHGFASLKSLCLQSCGLKGTVDMLEFNNLTNLKELHLGQNEIKSLGSLFQIKGQLRLMKLEVLGLSNNLFNNSIFSSLAALSNLKSLYIGGNNLKGVIHIQELNALMKLEVLGLSNNLFDNSIFSSLAGFSNLKSLYIDQNKLKGAIHFQELNALSNLVELDMSFNEVNNFVPSQDKKNELRLMNLEVLDLSGNLFNDSILSSLGRLSNLKSLSLGGENLEGSIDLGGLSALTNLEELQMDCSYSRACTFSLQSLGLFPLLKTLFLDGFSLYGTLITQSPLPLKNLESLYIWDSSLENNFLQKFGAMPSLKYLNLGDCGINGTLLTQGPLQLKNLESLDLENVNLENNFLQKIGAMPSLKYLQLSDCGVNGTLLTQGPLDLKNLESLHLDNVNLENNFLQKIGAMPSLKYLQLRDCGVNGTLLTQGPLHLKSLESLYIENVNLENNFLQKIGAMPSLKYLELRDCGVNGTLQGSLHLKNLESLYIYNTHLGNNFVQKIATMPSLKFLELQSCGLNGTFHIQGFCELTNLQELGIGGNNLKGNLPECFSNLTSLDSLALSSNQFSGNISALKSLTSLESLDLSSNQFSGNISALKSLTSLESLYLSNNNFEIPTSLEPLFNLSKLQYIDASNNIIYAKPEKHSLAPTFQLNFIDLSCCGEVGPFPQFLYHQHDLQYVHLSDLKLTGEFPKWLLKNNSNLDTLLLPNNSLQGHFELTFHSHKVLSILDISKNSFYGNIPNEIGAKLPSLRYLNMSENQFGGSIPYSIGDMNSLQILDLSNNKLFGEVPEHLAMGCSLLNALILSNNNLQGQMFSSNFNLISLKELKLDGNNFSGRIPNCLSNCSILSTLDLSNNNLFGEIPRWMGNTSTLEEIVMAKNYLEGPIPKEFCQLNLNLKLLDLSMNNIFGSLPSCFSPLWISQVHLSRNKLQGPLTSAFHNSTILVTLDLSYNHLNGSIPNWIGRLSQLSYLLLNNNHFEGRIPVQLCKLGNLSLINLSNNNLSGIIPPCLKITTLKNISQPYASLEFVNESIHTFSTEEPIEFTTKNLSYSYRGKVLTYFFGVDLSCNKLTGEIPHEVKNFQKIIVLNLSHNCLTGSIPPAISDLKQIESLDLSHNMLSGKIPSQLVALTFLVFFSVAYNNLSGSTPERLAQFALFEESSYLGNPFLCGAPLQKCLTDGPSSSTPKASTDNGLIDMNVFYVSFVVSYIMVLLSIASVLYINPYWRQAWFYHIEAGITSCYYFVVDNLLPKQFR